MVNRFPLHAMAAPSDPLSLKLEQQRSSDPNPNSNNSPWGTWEELVLGSAVLKHGADNWALVSTELQSHARASFSFTPEACRAGYQAIKLRFGAGEGRDGSAAHWYEELRRRRIACLKWELQQNNSSIGSLQNKIKGLQSEKLARAKSLVLHTRAKESAEALESTFEFSGDELARPKVRLSEIGEERESTQAREPTLQVIGEESHEHGTSDVGIPFSDDSAKPKESRSSSHGPVGEPAIRGLAWSYTSCTNDLISAGVDTHVSALIHPSGKSAPASLPNGGEEQQALALQHNGVTHDGGQLAARTDALGDTCTDHGDGSAKQGVSPSLKSVNIEDCKNLARAKAKASLCAVDGGEKSEDSESLCSPRLNSLSPIGNKRWRSPALGIDARIPDDADDKRIVRNFMGEKNFVDAVSSLPVESADSTEGKGGTEAFARKPSSLELMTSKVKKEMLAFTEQDAILPKEGTVKVEGGDQSRRVSTGALNAEARNHSRSSTENSLLHEVWGESVEANDNKTMKRSNKRRRLTGRDRKRKATPSFNTTDLEEDDDRGGIAEPFRQTEFTIKTESITTSQEGSESLHSPVGKVNDSEAWHQEERFSGDSRFEKSEMGSYVDGNEDISPMSRRNRREPKVSGKLIPLLESLRTVCAHRCAHFFRHNHEPEENRMYNRMVHMPIDLGTIRAKLEEGQYCGSMHFFRDLLLMVTNASVFYPRDSSEAAAASGLRECIMKEMGHVFETEVLVKQEGPSFRKRNKRQLAGGNQGRRKDGGGLRLHSVATEKPSREATVLKRPVMRDLAMAVKQSDVSTSVDSRRPSHQGFASRFDEKASIGDARRVDGGKRALDLQASREGARLLAFGPSSKAHVVKEPGSLKLGPFTLERANEAVGKDPGFNTVSMDAKLKQKLPEGGGEFTLKGGSTSKASALSKGIEVSGRKTKVVPATDVAQEPIKRGVGRPPKHSQLQRAREIEAPTNVSRKRARR